MKFGTIIADPPWAYGKTSNATRSTNEQDTKLRGYVDLKYKGVLTTDALVALNVESIVADKAVLLLWTTGPFLIDGSAARVAKAWGFEPVSLLVWHKLTAKGMPNYGGVGYWFRGNDEYVLVAKRGGSFRWNQSDWKGGDSGTGLWDWENAECIGDVKLGHSTKPTILHKRVEKSIYPKPYLELFGREERSAWTVVGNESPSCLGEDIVKSIERLAKCPSSDAQ